MWDILDLLLLIIQIAVFAVIILAGLGAIVLVGAAIFDTTEDELGLCRAYNCKGGPNCTEHEKETDRGTQ